MGNEGGWEMMKLWKYFDGGNFVLFPFTDIIAA